MKTVILNTLLLGILYLPLQAQTPQKGSRITPDGEIYTSVEQDPKFPGGMEALDRYIKANIRYPKAAKAAGLEGRVFVGFLITREGKTGNVEITKGLSPEINAEAIRLIETMPNWKPAKVKGNAVNSKYYLPINFSLD